MSLEFNYYSLGDLVKIKYGRNQKKVQDDENGKYPIYGTGGLMGYSIDYLYDKPSVLIGRKGSIEKVRYIEEPFWTVDTLFYTEVNDEIVIPKFLYYVMSLIDLSRYNEGTSIPSLRTKTLNRLDLAIPNLDYQKRVLTILSNIDKKISINEKINSNLDNILNSIFRENFITKFSYNSNLIVKKIGELPLIITDYVANGSFASLKENVSILDEENYAYFIRNIDLKANNFEKYVNKHSYEFLKKSKLFGNEIIISNVGDVGSVFLCPFLDKPMTLGNNMILVKTEDNYPNLNFYLYLLFKSDFGQYLINTITGGSVQLKFNKTEFKSLELFIPKSHDLNEFNKLVYPFFNYKKQISEEISNLIVLRDTLLPKLMSGEIDVSKINCDLNIDIIYEKLKSIIIIIKNFILNFLKYLWRL
ncbi:restriction endonuclease subunit S [Methanobrevibacter wolinii]|uniref:restriction endonuclease subunit S n=1 Tax=Methanobrevibacter wolinii TaxID=190977 RepID=UPI000A4B2717|nr:restriction endonuclease subunit S [Methanobrevibacter wolinii]